MGDVVEPRAVMMEELKKINARMDKIEALIDECRKIAEMGGPLLATVAPLIEGLKDNPLVGMFLGGMGNPFVANGNGEVPPINVLSLSKD